MHDWILVFTSGPQKNYKTYYRIAGKPDDRSNGPCIVYAWVNPKTGAIGAATAEDVAKNEAISTRKYIERYGRGSK